MSYDIIHKKNGWIWYLYGTAGGTISPSSYILPTRAAAYDDLVEFLTECGLEIPL